MKGQTMDDDIRKLLLTMRDVLDFVQEVDALPKIQKLQSTVASIMKQIYECSLFIQEYTKLGLASMCSLTSLQVKVVWLNDCDLERTIRDNVADSSRSSIDQFISTFNDLKSDFDRGIAIQTIMTVHRILPVLKEVHASGKFRSSYFHHLSPFSHLSQQETEKLLEMLPGWNLSNVKFNESKACLDGTRRQLLDDIQTWVHDPDGNRILWLFGGAGTGKSSVANSVAVFFYRLKRLGASFRFNRDIAGLNNPENLFGNLSYQLAHFDTQLKREILYRIERMGHVAGSSLRTQARELIVETINASKLLGPVVLVIDALDEAGTPQSRKEMLEAMAVEFSNLPGSIKIVITSRNQPDIRDSLKECSKEICIEDAEGTEGDINAYIKYRLSRIHQLSQDQCLRTLETLCDHAGQLFIWASVTCNFIEEGNDPALQLIHLGLSGHENTVTQSPLEKLHRLYNDILRNAISSQAIKAFKYVVGSILILERPLTCMELDSLLGLGNESTGYAVTLPDGDVIHLSSSNVIISSLQSIFMAGSTSHAGMSGTVRILHQSLYDFLTSSESHEFQIDIEKQSQIVSICCLKILNSELHFDICKINNPSCLNEEVKDLQQRIGQYMSGGLIYSSHSFTHHLLMVSNVSKRLDDELNEFLQNHLLHWIEVMSLQESINMTEISLLTLSSWMEVSLLVCIVIV
jgi:hypothetical protein